ncbi:MAG: glucose 1-dehydrogenase [Saccharolobus sp.]
MKALVVRPKNKGVELKEVLLKDSLANNEVLVKTIATGICGTDRGIVNGLLSFARPEDGKNELILGHEAFGQVLDVGSNVSSLRKGDYVVPIVRRGCGKCSNCLIGRQDFCETGNFVEAGIRGLDGFMREKFIDSEEYLVVIPDEIKDIAVLLEPLSNVVKAYNELMFLQRRMVWYCRDSSYNCRNVAIIGSGPIGNLFSMIFASQGFNVSILNRRDPSQVEAYISEKIGSNFINIKKDKLPEKIDVLIDTSGNPEAFIPLMSKLNKNSAVILFGTLEGEKTTISSDLITFMVENNILVIGSVNASKKDYEDGVNFLTIWKYRYGDILNKMITKVVKPEEATSALMTKIRGEIKTIISWS